MSYVYVITDDPYDPNHPVDGIQTVKIGFTSDRNVERRIGQLQTGNPRPLRIVEIFEFENSDMAKQIERLCHWNLKSSRLSGEWFTYDGNVINKLGSLSELSNHFYGNSLNEFLFPGSTLIEVSNG